MTFNTSTIRSECAMDEIRGGGGENIVNTLPYSNKVTKCGHGPKMYSKMFDSAYGERTLYFCICNECKIGTMGYLSPIDTVRAWDNNDVYSDCVTKDEYGMKLVWG